MLVGIQLGNVNVLNVDEVIKKLEQFRSSVEDGSIKAGMRHRYPKLTMILDVSFYSEFGHVANLFSAEGHSVKEYEDPDNEAIQDLTIHVDGSGDLTADKTVFREPRDEEELNEDEDEE